MKVRDVIRLIENDGWRIVAQKGSHRQFKHHVKPGRVTIAGARAKLDAEGYDRGQAITWIPERTKHLNRWRGTFQGESYAYTITEVELTD